MVYTMIYTIFLFSIYHGIYLRWYTRWYTTFGVVYTMRQPSRCLCNFSSPFVSRNGDEKLPWHAGFDRVLVSLWNRAGCVYVVRLSAVGSLTKLPTFHPFFVCAQAGRFFTSKQKLLRGSRSEMLDFVAEIQKENEKFWIYTAQVTGQQLSRIWLVVRSNQYTM